MPTKPQRHLDLLAYLVGRRVPVTVEELMERVPAYAEKWVDGTDTDRASVRRTFERDKDELKELGIPLEAVNYKLNYGTEVMEGYRLASRDFYLPYLRLVKESQNVKKKAIAAARPAEVELSAPLAAQAADALSRVAEMPAFPFAREAASALRKLRFDLPPEMFAASPVLYTEQPKEDEVAATLRVLSDALKARKRVRFTYDGMYRGKTTERDVALYGLLFQAGNWYAIGHDKLRDAVRVFRVGRMRAVIPNKAAPKTPDYEVPAEFDLHGYLDRDAWELGSEGEAPVRALVRFRFPSSLLAERNAHGELVESRDDGSSTRGFEVHQVNPFLRWVLSFAGEATIVEPPELADELRKLASAVAARHATPPVVPPSIGGDGRAQRGGGAAEGG